MWSFKLSNIWQDALFTFGGLSAAGFCLWIQAIQAGMINSHNIFISSCIALFGGFLGYNNNAVKKHTN
jgi:hypothetical protein